GAATAGVRHGELHPRPPAVRALDEEVSLAVGADAVDRPRMARVERRDCHRLRSAERGVNARPGVAPISTAIHATLRERDHGGGAGGLDGERIRALRYDSLVRAPPSHAAIVGLPNA